MTESESSTAKATAAVTDILRGDGVAAVAADCRPAGRRQSRMGRFRPGEQLPVEATLASDFAVNRHTVRRALAALAAGGLVRATQGRGDVCRGEAPAPIRSARGRGSPSSSRAAGREAGGKLIASAKATPTAAEIAQALNIARGASVLRLETVRSADGTPISMGTAHFPLPRFAKLAGGYRKTGSTTKALKLCGVADYLRSETRVSARPPTAEEARLLDVAGGRPVLTVTSTNVDPDGLPIQFTHGGVRGGPDGTGDRELTTTLIPAKAGIHGDDVRDLRSAEPRRDGIPAFAGTSVREAQRGYVSIRWLADNPPGAAGSRRSRSATPRSES